MFGLGPTELFLIFGIVLVLFGAKRLPGIASGLGGAIHSFRDGLKGDHRENLDEGKKDPNKQLSENTKKED